MDIVTFPARLESLAPCVAFVSACATAAGFPPQRITEIELAVEEVLTNIYQYAYTDVGGEVEIHCRRDETQQWVIEFIDTGKPFNLLSLPSPDLTVDLEHRQIGGLGVPLIRAMVDTLTYRRDSDRNILRLGVQQRYDTP